MESIAFLAVSRSPHIFDVALGGEVIGIVWLAENCWYASQYNMADKDISGPSREDAARALITRLNAHAR
jgi:hypothetical protein